MMTLKQKAVALVTVSLVDLLFFLFSPILGILALAASIPFVLAVVHQ